MRPPRFKLTKAIAYLRCPDMVFGQRWRGITRRYRFHCEIHGEYLQRYSHHFRGQGCKQCAIDVKRPDHTNKRIGNWLVLAQVKTKDGRSCWRCRCDCGRMRVFRTDHLGRLTKCGHCANRDELGHTRRLPGAQGMRNAILQRYKKSAQERGYDWAITNEEFDLLVKQNCFYCGAAPKGGTGRQVRSQWAERFIYNGIDRQQNDLGYTPINCVACCRICNEWKRTRSVTEFIKHAQRIYEHLEIQNAGPSST